MHETIRAAQGPAGTVKEWSDADVKILAISDVPSRALWDYCSKTGWRVDLILSCGDLPKRYLEHLTNFTTAPILYVHGNHDGSYKGAEPGGCICVDDQVYVWKGLRIMGLGAASVITRRIPISIPSRRCGGASASCGCGPIK